MGKLAFLFLKILLFDIPFMFQMVKWPISNLQISEAQDSSSRTDDTDTNSLSILTKQREGNRDERPSRCNKLKPVSRSGLLNSVPLFPTFPTRIFGDVIRHISDLRHEPPASVDEELNCTPVAMHGCFSAWRAHGTVKSQRGSQGEADNQGDQRQAW